MLYRSGCIAVVSKSIPISRIASSSSSLRSNKKLYMQAPGSRVLGKLGKEDAAEKVMLKTSTAVERLDMENSGDETVHVSSYTNLLTRLPKSAIDSNGQAHNSRRERRCLTRIWRGALPASLQVVGSSKACSNKGCPKDASFKIALQLSQ